jgi:hypothetical protein
MINLIKTAVYTKLNTLFRGKVFYSFAPIADGKHYIYDVITADDSSTHCSTNLAVLVQVLVVYPETAETRTTSVEPDNDLATIIDNLKLADLSASGSYGSVQSKSMVVDMVSPSKFDPQTKQFVGFVRFRADFTINKK